MMKKQENSSLNYPKNKNFYEDHAALAILANIRRVSRQNVDGVVADRVVFVVFVDHYHETDFI